MKATDRLFLVAVMAANKVNKESLDETLRAFEAAGLVDHTYVEDRKGNAVIEYHFTPKFRALVEGI